MFKKRNVKNLILVLVLLAIAFGYGPMLLSAGSGLARGLKTLSPILVFVLGVVVGKVLL